MDSSRRASPGQRDPKGPGPGVPAGGAAVQPRSPALREGFQQGREPGQLGQLAESDTRTPDVEPGPVIRRWADLPLRRVVPSLYARFMKKFL